MQTSVIIPTYNEVGNLEALIDEILENEDVQVIVVDDESPDGTGQVADELAKTKPVKVIHRKDKMGLASAILDGFRVAKTPIVGVIDADFSHPPGLIPELTKLIKEKNAQVVFASRKVYGGGVQDWPLWRKITSSGAALFTRGLTNVKDPMSGYFFLEKKVIEDVELETVGFKLGLEILVKGRYDKVVEVPFIFRNRRVGKSKLGGGEYVNYVKHLIRLYSHKLGLR